jgi:general secretion pathway protein J
MMLENRNRNILAEAGFTLLELLIAITLVGMMAVGVWAIFSISVRSWSRGIEAIDANQRHRSVLDMTRKQLASAYPIYSNTDTQSAETASIIFNGTENGIHFVSLTSLQFFESPGLTLVSYEMVQDSDGTLSLIEKEARFTGQDDSLNDSRTIPIFRNLQTCTFEYYNSGNAEEPARWVSEWDGSASARLPAAIRMTMVSRDSQGNPFNRQMVIPVHAQESLSTTTFINPFGNRNLSRGRRGAAPSSGRRPFPVDRN